MVGEAAGDAKSPDGKRARQPRRNIRLYRTEPTTTPLSWIGAERIAIGAVPTTASIVGLTGHGVTHVINCRATAQTWTSRDLAVERAVFGPSRVVHAPMWDTGRSQHPRLWSAAAHFASTTLADDAEARVLIHCHQGRRRSVLVAYAVLRLRGHSATDAADLIHIHRREAELVTTYQASVEAWLAAGAAAIGRLRIR
jgi:predicted protein tyrosine phosphatase